MEPAGAGALGTAVSGCHSLRGHLSRGRHRLAALSARPGRRVIPGGLLPVQHLLAAAVDPIPDLPRRGVPGGRLPPADALEQCGQIFLFHLLLSVFLSVLSSPRAAGGPPRPSEDSGGGIERRGCISWGRNLFSYLFYKCLAGKATILPPAGRLVQALPVSCWSSPFPSYSAGSGGIGFIKRKIFLARAAHILHKLSRASKCRPGKPSFDASF